MPKPFEFFFDYVSPTAFFAQKLAIDLADRTGAPLIYRPMFLGGVMQATGNSPPGMVAAKGAYMQKDMARCAAYHGIAFHNNPHFPMQTLGLLRATLGLSEDMDAQLRFIDTCFEACWGQENPINPAEPDQVKVMCEEAGFDYDKIAALGKNPEMKARLIANTEEAIARGVFGAPSFFVGEELFFGHDRLDYVERAVLAV